MLKIKSVYDPIKKEDGLRILVTRFRGRGLKSNRYHVWMANLGPSEKLLRMFQSRNLSDKNWKEYARNYKKEILSSSSMDSKNRSILNHGQKFTLRLLKELSKRQTVTIMCHCATDQKYCHTKILNQLIKQV
ncbi:MAG: DUF488 family protein [Desulfobacterales bacterium]|jgi:uncharacterized protein YeaO (DUF488 family)|nr:DUF488 family protein [Desulfobacterales bacterium]